MEMEKMIAVTYGVQEESSDPQISLCRNAVLFSSAGRHFK